MFVFVLVFVTMTSTRVLDCRLPGTARPKAEAEDRGSYT
jgi:hypothetical protein